MIKWVLFFCVFPFAMWAAPIVVKSGEHTGFTRLVVYLSDEENWSIEQSNGLAVFSVEGWQQGYDISAVFERINKDRLKSLAASESNLVMNLNCACEFDVSELPQGFVSIDIRNSQTPRPVPKPAVERQAEEPTQNIELVPSPIISWPLVFENAVDYSSFDRILANAQSAKSTAFEGELSEEISRSATLTYLEPSGAELDREQQRDPMPGTRSQEDLLAILGERAKFLNAADIGNPAEEVVEICPAPESLTVSKWGGDLPFSEQHAELRGRLISEFDALDQVAVRDFVRFLIHYGLAPEARNTMTAFEYEGSVRLHQLAAFVSGERHDAPNLSELVGCEGETGFWAFLTNPEAQEQTQETIERHVSIFQRLPFDLQSLVADQLIEKLKETGFETAAGVVRNTIIANSSDDISEDAGVALASDMQSRNRDELLLLIAKNDAQSPDALLVLLQQSNSKNLAVSNDLLELSRSFVHQLDGTDVSVDLLVGLIEATAVSGNLDLAISETFAEADGRLADETDLIERLFEISLLDKDVPNISRLVWKLHGREQLDLIPIELREGGADLFARNGHPQLALLVLGNGATTAPPEILASAYSQLGNSESTVELVQNSNFESLSADLSARVLKTDPEVAWGLRDILTGAAAEQAAWSSQNWSDVPGETARARASGLILRAQQVELDPAAPIRDAKGAQDISRETRQVLADLLN